MNSRTSLLLVGAVVAWATSAAAHVSITSGPLFAGKSQELTFGVGHGCEGADTWSVRVEIPAAITTVRAMTSDFGRPTLEKDAAGLVTAVTWQKADGDLFDADELYYKLTLRIKAPEAPFTRLVFPVHQTCKTKDGATLTVDWIGTDPANKDIEPAPAAVVVPPRMAGWNKVTVPAAIPSLGAYFGDALIVWRGKAAWSPNPNTTELIGTTAGVTALESLSAGDDVWVRY